MAKKRESAKCQWIFEEKDQYICSSPIHYDLPDSKLVYRVYDIVYNDYYNYNVEK